MAAGDDALVVLQSIDATLKSMLVLAQQRSARAAASQPKAVATDQDLDGKYGDPVVKFMPRDWTGPTFVNRAMSECPPELLDLLAETFDYFAKKAAESGELTAKGRPVADFKRADAARARGWAARMRSGKHTPSLPSEQSDTEWTGTPGGWA